MRYQPLVATDQPPKSSTGDFMSSDTRPSNILRPLPRIPPKASHPLQAASAGIILPTFTSSRPSVAIGSNIKRPQTTTGILGGASTTRSASVHVPGLSRSPFDNATPYWAVRQPDINALPISSPTTAPRTRSQSARAETRSIHRLVLPHDVAGRVAHAVAGRRPSFAHEF